MAEILQRCDFAAAAQYGDQIMTTASATMLGEEAGSGIYQRMFSSMFSLYLRKSTLSLLCLLCHLCLLCLTLQRLL